MPGDVEGVKKASTTKRRAAATLNLILILTVEVDIGVTRQRLDAALIRGI